MNLDKKKQFKQITLAGLIVFTFFFVFQPFGLKVEPIDIIFKSALYYGLGTVLISSINNLILPYFFSDYFNEEKWTFGRNLFFGFWFLITLTITMIFIGKLIFPETQISTRGVLKMFLYVFILGQFIFIVISYLNQSFLSKKHEILSVEIQKQIPHDKTDNELTEIIVPIPFDFDINIKTSDICFIESLGNYLKVFWINGNGHVQNVVVRKSITDTEKELKEAKYIFKSHRSYLVNLNKIEKITGDSQGLKLKLRSIEQKIPVSRSRVKAFKTLFTNGKMQSVTK